jgi:hypothetical protein
LNLSSLKMMPRGCRLTIFYRLGLEGVYAPGPGLLVCEERGIYLVFDFKGLRL